VAGVLEEAWEALQGPGHIAFNIKFSDSIASTSRFYLKVGCSGPSQEANKKLRLRSVNTAEELRQNPDRAGLYPPEITHQRPRQTASRASERLAIGGSER
jgi:hypothetical protein